MTISKEVLDELLNGVKNADDLLGDQGMMKELKVRLMERMLGAETRSKQRQHVEEGIVLGEYLQNLGSRRSIWRLAESYGALARPYWERYTKKIEEWSLILIGGMIKNLPIFGT